MKYFTKDCTRCPVMISPEVKHSMLKTEHSGRRCETREDFISINFGSRAKPDTGHLSRPYVCVIDTFLSLRSVQIVTLRDIGGSSDGHYFIPGLGREHKFSVAATRVPRQCPLILKVKVGFVQLRRLESGEGRMNIEARREIELTLFLQVRKSVRLKLCIFHRYSHLVS